VFLVGVGLGMGFIWKVDNDLHKSLMREKERELEALRERSKKSLREMKDFSSTIIKDMKNYALFSIQWSVIMGGNDYY